ncbi:MAG TPA: hypothetical protein VHW44_16310 [Pseudonocardiaceae bacterium]|jgi:hypothetical protein|nr:hypothetical protein [Pseudonocardiaceae bacterium]
MTTATIASPSMTTRFINTRPTDGGSLAANNGGPLAADDRGRTGSARPHGLATAVRFVGNFALALAEVVVLGTDAEY